MSQLKDKEQRELDKGTKDSWHKGYSPACSPSFKLASDVPSGWWPEGHSLHWEGLQSHIPPLENFKSGLTEPASCFPPGAGGWILPATWKPLVPSPLSLWLTPAQAAAFLLQDFLSPPGFPWLRICHPLFPPGPEHGCSVLRAKVHAKLRL